MITEIKSGAANISKRLAHALVLISLGMTQPLSWANRDLVPRSCRYVLVIQTLEKKNKVEISNRSTSASHEGAIAFVFIEKHVGGGSFCKSANETLKVLLLYTQGAEIAVGDRVTAVHYLDDPNAIGALYEAPQMFVE